MTAKDPIANLLDKTLWQSELPGLPAPQRGKVRDIYDLGDRLLLVTTDRISAFDVVLGTIPCKGQVLCSIAAHWFEKTADLVPNHLIDLPDPCAMLVKKLKPLPVEVVMRRHITGSLWREYEAGNRNVYGLELEDGMQPDQRFEEPILTPTTKAELGQHDLPLTPQEVVDRGLVDTDLWQEVQKAALALFTRGEEEARARDLILVDTKYEFGLDGDRLVVMDEIHTPDSSRYWELSEYQKRYAQGQAQHMLDKENIRQWLLERGFSGEGRPPDLTEEVRVFLSRRYLQLQKRLTGTEPELPSGDPARRLVDNLKKAGIIK
jgi:phosphoribosylaminoimidazole-succinocarboxamide synthase